MATTAQWRRFETQIQPPKSAKQTGAANPSGIASLHWKPDEPNVNSRSKFWENTQRTLHVPTACTTDQKHTPGSTENSRLHWTRSVTGPIWNCLPLWSNSRKRIQLQITRPSKSSSSYHRTCAQNSTVSRLPETRLPTKPDQGLGLELRKHTMLNKIVISLPCRLNYMSYKKCQLSESVDVNTLVCLPLTLNLPTQTLYPNPQMKQPQ